MSKPPKAQSVPAPATPRAHDDPLLDYLAVSVSRTRSGAVAVRVMRMDANTRRLVSETLLEGQEARTSPAAMAEWLEAGAEEHKLDVEEQLRIW